MQCVEIAMRETQQQPTSAFVKIAGKPCAAAISPILARGARYAPAAIVSRLEGQKRRRADSESRFLAMKIFS
jgi:hypothetical protein